MKKKSLLIFVILLFTTGCTCEYNLTINNDTFNESVQLIGENSEEITSFNNKWEIPVDKNEFNRPGDTESNPSVGGTYKYNLSNSNLVFTNNFTIENYSDSSAVSVCYKTLKVGRYDSSIIISSSNEVDCFNRYPTLNKVTINVTIDKPVISNNADSVNGKTYTWHINKNDNNKPINIVIDDKDKSANMSTNNKTQDDVQKKDKDKYTLYIVLGVILVVFLLGYLIISILVNREDNMDD